MQITGTYPQNMPRDECLRLMATTGVGRIIYTRRALPAVELVPFVLEGGDVVVRTIRDQVASAIRDSVVAFEADQVSPRDRIGWTVTVIGRTREDGGGAHSPDGREHVIRIRPEVVAGIRFAIPAANPAPSSGADGNPPYQAGSGTGRALV
jgi:uncharacterized protein